MSPEVAVTIMIFSSPVPSFEPVRAMRRGSIWRATSLKALVEPVRAMRRGSIWRATSLKALVGPCHSSSTCVGTPSALVGARRLTGVISASAKVSSYASETHAAISSGA